MAHPRLPAADVATAAAYANQGKDLLNQRAVPTGPTLSLEDSNLWGQTKPQASVDPFERYTAGYAAPMSQQSLHHPTAAQKPEILV